MSLYLDIDEIFHGASPIGTDARMTVRGDRITIDLPRYIEPDRDLRTAIAVLTHIVTRLKASQAVQESDRLAEFFSGCPIPDCGRLDIRELREIECLYGEQHPDL